MQLVVPVINLFLGASWIYVGFKIESGHFPGKIFYWIIGSVFIVLSIASIISIIIRRKRYPIEDSKTDEKMAEDLKIGGFASLFITALLLIAIVLAWILT